MNKPVRIRLSRTKGWKMPANAVKVDRTTKWGNPFRPADVVAGKAMGQAGAVEAYHKQLQAKLQSEPEVTRAELEKLRGKHLACWCKPGEPCHADVLLKLANE